MSSQFRVSVIVPTRNRTAALKRLVESVLVSDELPEIIVVDDGSDDPVTCGPGVVTVRHDAARQLSAARNAGAKAATGDVLFFIDDDCVVRPSTIGLLRARLENDPRVAMVGPTIAYLAEPERIWCAGVEHRRWSGLTRLRGSGRHVSEADHLPTWSDDFPSAFAVRRAVFEEVGGFDEVHYPAHMDEADLGQRLRALGHEIELVPRAVVLHDIERASVLRRLHVFSEGRAFLMARDRARYIRRLPASRLRRASNAAFWIAVIAPVYLLAIMMASPDRCVPTAAAFVRGAVDGFLREPEFARESIGTW